MKPQPIIKTNFQSLPVTTNWDSLKTPNEDNPFSFQDFILRQPMTQHQVEPPPYIWDRIANALDQQEHLQTAPKVFAAVADHEVKKHQNRKVLYYVAGVMALGVLIYSIV